MGTNRARDVGRGQGVRSAFLSCACQRVRVARHGLNVNPLAQMIDQQFRIAGALCVFAIAGKEGTVNELNLAQTNKKRIFGLHRRAFPVDG
jgi:hypothetical protein